MKEIKFRAKNNAGNWIYFSVIHNGIKSEGIDQNTLGQYIKKKDKNGKEIYEGDIVQGEYKDYVRTGIDKIKGIVEFKNGKIYVVSKEYYYHFDGLAEIEVIGNIIDNKELLNK